MTGTGVDMLIGTAVFVAVIVFALGLREVFRVAAQLFEDGK